MRVVPGILLSLVLVSGCGGAGEPTSAPAFTKQPQPSESQAQGRMNASKAASAAEEVKRAAAKKATAAVRKRDAARAEAAKASRRFVVLDVIDGDTVRVDYRGGVSVRVIGIDTPETVSPIVADECGGQAASDAARRLLFGKSVTMTFDSTQDRADKYGRPLVYLGVPGVGDFGRAMIQSGEAAEYTYDAAYQRRGVYRAAERVARIEKRGLWGSCGGPDKPLKNLKPPSSVAVGSSSRCMAGYKPCVPPFPPDVNCDDVDGPITVTGSDPHQLDSDGDGLACES
jgi:micrococcal nuclease